MNPLDELKDKIKNGNFNYDEMPLPDNHKKTMDNALHAKETYSSNKSTEKGMISNLIFSAGEIFSAVNQSNKKMKAFLGCGIALIAYSNVINPIYQDIVSAKANPALYSANPIKNIFGDGLGDENAPVTKEYQKAWMETEISPLHDIVKKEIAPVINAALEDKKLTIKETVDISNKVSLLNEKFFGTPIPNKNAEPILSTKLKR